MSGYSRLFWSKWTIDILKLLSENSDMRFSEVMSSLDITDKVLSEKLGELVGHDLVVRTLHVDRTTTYSLSEKGRRAVEKLAELDKIMETD